MERRYWAKTGFRVKKTCVLPNDWLGPGLSNSPWLFGFQIARHYSIINYEKLVKIDQTNSGFFNLSQSCLATKDSEPRRDTNFR